MARYQVLLTITNSKTLHNNINDQEDTFNSKKVQFLFLHYFRHSLQILHQPVVPIATRIASAKWPPGSYPLESVPQRIFPAVQDVSGPEMDKRFQRVASDVWRSVTWTKIVLEDIDNVFVIENVVWVVYGKVSYTILNDNNIFTITHMQLSYKIYFDQNNAISNMSQWAEQLWFIMIN